MRTIVQTGRIDQFLPVPARGATNGRNLWNWPRRGPPGQAAAPKFEAALRGLAATEEFHAYPGLQLMTALRDHAAEDDAQAAASLARRITRAILTRSFRQNPGDWDAHEEGEGVAADVLPPALGRADAHRPYFETLIVTGAPAARWPALAAEWRRLRRPLDAFVYEPVIRRQLRGRILRDACSTPILPPS